MQFYKDIAALLESKVSLSLDEIENMIEVPKEVEMGDYAFPCFRLAKQLRKSPAIIAKDIAADITAPDFVSKVEVAGGYINFFVDRETLAKKTLAEAISAGENYGRSEIGKGKTVCIDFSSINIAKPFHIGHLSSTAIGNSLYKIYSYLGYNCVGINHLGDWGTQFGKLIVAYKKWGNKEKINEEGISALLKIYVKFHQEAENDESLDEQARYWFKQLEDGNEEATELYNWFKKLTLDNAAKVYDLLGVRFDSYNGEAFYNDKMDPVIKELDEKGLLVDSKGAKVVMLDEYDLPPCIILKSDGATLYSTRDIAAAFYRKNNYNFYKSLYVVAYQQTLHFKQFFKVIELMGYEWAKDMEHVAFGMVSVEDGTLSTRQGNVILLEDVLNKAIAKTREIIEQKSPDLADKDAIAKQIGVGAIVFSTLLNGRIKDIQFSFDKVLNFDGETGPYVQYTHARCCSVIEKAGDIGEPDYKALLDDEAQALLKLIASLEESIMEAHIKNEPFMVTRHIIEIAKAYNKFYFEHRIISDDKAAMAARVQLTIATRNAIKIGLSLLGIEAPEKM